MTSNDAAAPIAWGGQERRHQPKNPPLEISDFINTIYQFRTFAVLEYGSVNMSFFALCSASFQASRSPGTAALRDRPCARCA